MTDRELAVAAEQALRRTTVAYPEWLKRKNAGRYTPKDGSGTEWGKAFAALERIGVAQPPPDPDPDPPGQFGTSLPAPAVTVPNASPQFVATLSALRSAIAGSAPLIELSGAISGSGDIDVTRPVVIRGGKTTGLRWMISAVDRVMLQGIEIAGGHDGVKVDEGSSDILLDRLYVHDSINMGINVQYGGSRNVQVTRCRVSRVGYTIPSGFANQHHGLYVADADGFLVASCLFEDQQAYGIQLYPECKDGIVTGTTIKGGRARGGIYVGDGDVHGVRFVGVHVPTSPSGAIDGGAPQTTAYDCIGPGMGAGIQYVHCGPDDNPKGFVQSSRYGLLPAADIDGKPRVTADAGCVAL